MKGWAVKAVKCRAAAADLFGVKKREKNTMLHFSVSSSFIQT